MGIRFKSRSGGFNATYPKVTADTPIEELQDIHKRIWDYTIQHGEKPDNPYIDKCVACEYACGICGFDSELENRPAILTDIIELCNNCPIKWEDGLICYQTGSLYRRWYFSYGDIHDEYAKQIRDVEFIDKTKE